MKKKSFLAILLSALLILQTAFAGGYPVLADEATQVTIGKTDYDDLTVAIYKNGNGVAYYSTDARKTWKEVEGISCTDESGKDYIEMDISWANPSADVKVYLKGDKVKTEQNFTLPKQNSSLKVKFDKASGDFDITTTSGATNFYWRKSTDYNWRSVPFDRNSNDYKAFLADVAAMRFKGAKLIFKTGQTQGTGADNMGERPGKEVSVSITKLGSAPSIKINMTKLTANTKDSMEYTTDLKGTWKSCEKAMSIADMAPGSFYKDGKEGTDTKLYIRTAQTTKKPSSLIASVVIPGQTGAPDVGASGKDVSYAFDSEGKKLEIKFETASESNMFEYCVITPSKTFDLNTSKWVAVKKQKTVKLTEKAAPDKTVIYVRLR
ncbi:MAG: hypothetical protein K6G81_07345 [Lachnospiraceae bacterium]|nr:hypothetical protein [Lachnospiraceae bacterium]